MSDFEGPACGIDGCERELGHIGAHHRVELVGRFDPPLSTSDALLIVRRWVDAIGCVDMLTKRRIKKAEAIEMIDLLIRDATENIYGDPG